MRRTSRLCTCAGLGLLLTVGALGCNEAGQTEIARGNVLASRRQFDEAAQAYRAAAEAAPGKARPRELLGHLMFDQRRLAEARAAYEDALRVEPQAAMEAELGLARLDAEEGKLDPAIERLTRILERQPTNLFARLSRANLALQRGKPEDSELALEDTARAMAIDSKNEAVLYGRGRAFIAQGKFAEAKETFDLLAKAHPRSYLPAYGYARLAAAQGDKAGALAHLREARQKTPPALWRAAEVQADPAFRSLQGDPDFTAAVGGS
jgi:tetratricopeptide (TPR) repeat protein